MAEDENGTATVSYQDVDAEVDVVRVVEGPDAGLTALLHDEPLRIGTGEGMDLRLSDRGISRGHCRLVREAGHVRVVDLGSKNGTWIAGCRVRDADLPAGTRLRLSSTAIELSVDKCRVRAAVWTGGNRFGEVVGRAPSTHRLFVQLARIADASGAVLICGETGTGKDVVARTIHSRGPRANAPFVVVDGGALSRALADSELFGHVRGAFTDAVADRAGAFERAHGGTLFIDEIGDLPLDVQPKLLRALDRGEVHRVGSSERTRCDVRVIAATHRSLDRMVNERSFREDLLRRLSVFEVRLPPLRERPEDIPLLAVSFLTELGMRDPALAVSLEQALAARAGHTWPGNVTRAPRLRAPIPGVR
jgi:transcriptional regulator of acetoin/glycerol metabolism